MGADIALCPNGVNVGFYQKNWDLVGTNIVRDFLDVLNNDASVSEINNVKLSSFLRRKVRALLKIPVILAYAMYFTSLLPKFFVIRFEWF